MRKISNLFWWLLGGAGAGLVFWRGDKLPGAGGRDKSDQPGPIPRPDVPYLQPAEREARFGPAGKHLVDTQFLGFPVTVHLEAAPSLAAVESEIQALGMAPLVEVVQSYNYRPIRGSETGALSPHAYGLALDINPSSAPQGSQPTPALEELARVFARHGWWWGNWYRPPTLPDPHHFEYIGDVGNLEVV